MEWCQQLHPAIAMPTLEVGEKTHPGYGNSHLPSSSNTNNKNITIVVVQWHFVEVEVEVEDDYPECFSRHWI